MVIPRDTKLRFVRHYLSVAQQSRTNLDAMLLESPNIMRAMDYCVNLEEWQLLTSLTGAINDYLRRMRPFDYIKFNDLSVANDHTQKAGEKAERLRQSGRLEEAFGNYDGAIARYEQLLQLCERDEDRNFEAALDALQQLSKLSRAKGRYDEAVRYLQEVSALTRQYGSKKDELDALYNLAVLYEKQGYLHEALKVCDGTLRAAQSFGYVAMTADLLIQRASLLTALHKFQDASDALREALEVASRMSDASRVESINSQLAGLGRVMGKNIFISYSHQDRPFVSRLAGDLKAAGLPVWWDQWEIGFGDSITRKVSDGIEKSAYLLAVLSPRSVQSDWVRLEIGSGMMRQLSAEKDIAIIPLLLADCEIPALLLDWKWVDFRADYGSSLNKLLGFFVNVTR